jgi:hypothetical protein
MSRDAHHAPNATYYEAQLLAARALVERLRKRVKARVRLGATRGADGAWGADLCDPAATAISARSSRHFA